MQGSELLCAGQTTTPSSAKPSVKKKSLKKKPQKKKRQETSLGKKTPLVSPPSKGVDLPITENLSILESELPKRIDMMNKVSTPILKSVEGESKNASSNHPESSVTSASPPSIIQANDVSLTIHSKKLPGIALIRILDAYWLFLDQKYPFTLPTNYPYGIFSMEDKSTEQNTIVKIILRRGFWPNIRAEKETWTLDFNISPRLSRTKKVMRWPDSIDKPIKILMPSYVGEIPWVHPEMKIPISIFTSRKQDGAFTPQQSYPQLTLMESYVGLAIQPISDSLVVRRDVEDLDVFDARGIALGNELLSSKENLSILADTRRPYKIEDELQSLKNKKRTPAIMMKIIELSLKLGFFSEAGAQFKALDALCTQGVWVDQAKVDLFRLVLLTLSPNDESASHPIDFTHHNFQSPEFHFWYNLYRKNPQNYEPLIKHIISHYPLFLKNEVVEILLSVPDEYENLRSLIGLQGIDRDLKDKARLKLALMEPIDIRELKDLVKYSKNREIQAKAQLQILYEEQKEKDFNPLKAIKILESYLFSFGDKEFEAKVFLAKLYVGQRDYTQAIRLLKDLSLEDKNRRAELNEHMRYAYLQFFEDVFQKEEVKQNNSKNKKNSEGLENFNPQPLDIVAFYNDFNHLTPDGEKGKKILNTVIDALKKLSLYRPAIEILSRQFEKEKNGPDKTSLTFQIADLYKMLPSPEDVEKILNTLDDTTMSEADVLKKRYLLVESYLLQNQPGKALSLVENDKSLEGEISKERIYWHLKDFNKILELVPLLLQRVNDKEKRAFLATRLAIANVLVQNPPYPFEDLRMRYINDVKNTMYEKDFLVATTPEIRVEDGLLYFPTLDPLLKPNA